MSLYAGVIQALPSQRPLPLVVVWVEMLMCADTVRQQKRQTHARGWALRRFHSLIMFGDIEVEKGAFGRYNNTQKSMNHLIH